MQLQNNLLILYNISMKLRCRPMVRFPKHRRHSRIEQSARQIVYMDEITVPMARNERIIINEVDT